LLSTPSVARIGWKQGGGFGLITFVILWDYVLLKYRKDYEITMMYFLTVGTVLRSVSEGTGFQQLKKNGGVQFVSIIRDYDDIVRRLAE